ncbi:MAG: adenine phosphoribosyltransferase [Planctomycetota bacterium]
MSHALDSFVRDIPDFPKPGILFKDISPLLRDAGAFSQSVDALGELYKGQSLEPTVCAGPEARGFIFASALAVRSGLGLVPIRKPGKLPADVIQVEYDLEYGTDALQVHSDAISSGDRVLLVDDVLATGGTMEACARLVESSGAKVEGILFLLELSFLSGRERLAQYPVHSLLSY